MPVKTKKVTKKVSTAKGKGKPAKAKVVKKTATKKVAKVTVSKAVVAKKIAKANKPAVKKVRAPKMVDPNKYGKFVIEDCPNEKYPTMVTITTAPAAYSNLVGKKYVSRERFITFIEGEKAYVSISKGAKKATDELAELGFASPDVAVITPGFKEVNPSIMANEYGA
jgi:hypothetical protein